MKKINYDMPAISVIIPTYNRKEHVERTIKDALKQTLENFEIVCVDDGSTDGTWLVLQRLGELDRRVRIFHKENGGAGSARNLGIEQSKGEYLFFLDSDDKIYNNNTLNELYKNAKIHKALICGGKMLIKTGNDLTIVKDTSFPKDGFIDYKCDQNGYYFSRFIYNKKLIIENEIRFPILSDYEDPVFLVQCMVKAKRFYYVDNVVYEYDHQHQVNSKISQRVFIDKIRGITEILRLSSENSLEKLHYKMYSALIDCAENNGYEFLPNTDLDFFVVLLKANEAIDKDLLYNSEMFYTDRKVLPILEFIWNNSNKYQMLRKKNILKLFKSNRKNK